MPSTASRIAKVRFFPLARSKDTISRHDMTEDEIQRCFLQEEEYEKIWEHNDRLMRRAKHYHSSKLPLPSPLPKCLMGYEDDIETKLNGDYLCTRGLARESKRRRRRETIHIVLEEQYFQSLEGYKDVEQLSEIYSLNSAQCRYRAVCRAMEDRIDTVETQSSTINDDLLQ